MHSDAQAKAVADPVKGTPPYKTDPSIVMAKWEEICRCLCSEHSLLEIKGGEAVPQIDVSNPGLLTDATVHGAVNFPLPMSVDPLKDVLMLYQVRQVNLNSYIAPLFF